MDPGLNELLKWSVENSGTDGLKNGEGSSSRRAPDAEVLASLMGAPSDADLMKASMQTIVSSTESLENKSIAFDNLEQLIESIDNANNLQPLNLWDPLLGQLDSLEPEIRRMACWCIGTAVQNNPKSQENALVLETVPKLVKLATSDEDVGVRRKATYALSSEIRNYAPALKIALEQLPDFLKPLHVDSLDAEDMDGIDEIVSKLRSLEQPVR